MAEEQLGVGGGVPGSPCHQDAQCDARDQQQSGGDVGADREREAARKRMAELDHQCPDVCGDGGRDGHGPEDGDGGGVRQHSDDDAERPDIGRGDPDRLASASGRLRRAQDGDAEVPAPHEQRGRDRAQQQQVHHEPGGRWQLAVHSGGDGGRRQPGQYDG